MKKKLLAAVMCICLGMTMFGCSKDKDTDNSSKSGTSDSKVTDPAYSEEDLVDDTESELNVLDYVELGNYKGLEITKTVTPVTDEDVQSEMESKAIELTSGDAVVADGDTTIIDFAGKLDGVAFDGGTASNYELKIGSNSFIEGFEDGLIGVKKGQTVDLNLKFPDDYKSTDLAGKDVVFTVTVHQIKRTAELNDEWISSNTSYASLADYTAATRTELETSADETAQQNAAAAALDQVISGSKIKKYFKSLIEQGEEQYENYIKTYAAYSGKEFSEFIKAQGMSEEDYANTKQKQGVSYAEGAMVVYAVAKDAGLTEDDEEYQKLLQELAATYNMDVATLNSTYGESLVKSSVMPQYVMNYIVSNGNVTTTTAEEETTVAE